MHTAVPPKGGQQGRCCATQGKGCRGVPMPLAPPRIGLHISASNWASQDTSQLLCVKFYHFFYCLGKSNDRTKSTLVKSAHARLANQPHDASSYCKRNSWLPGEGIVRDIGKVMYTLLYLKWLTNKDLLHTTSNSAQCYVPAWMGGKFGEEWIHVYMSMYG